MKKIIQEYIKKQIEDGKLLSFGDDNEFFSIIDNIKDQYLYPNMFHGLYHSQKVCFFAYLIGKHYGLNDDDIRILTDAAIYHDIGRRDDSEGDELHGYASTLKIDKILKYENPTDMYYLKAIMEAHSKSDEKSISVYDNWRCTKMQDDEFFNRHTENFDMEKFMILSDILKDADALDRLRFRNCTAMLDESYLRCPYSKKLINLSWDLNDYYYKVDVEEQYQILKSTNQITTENKEVCYHSVGFDFFKALSILQSGILSHYNAMLNGVKITRNFNGNNSEFWISVVDANETKNNEAYERYVKNGISFYCYVNKLVSGVDRARDTGSLEPRISGEYHDEKFVFDKIPVENIQFISIPKKLMNKSIKDLKYLYCNSQYELIKMNIDNYINEIETYCDIKIPRSEFDKILNELQNEQTEFNKTPRGEVVLKAKAYFAKVDYLKEELNKILQRWIQTGFSELMNKNFDETITLGEVVKYLLDAAHIDYVPINDNLDDVEDEEEKFMNFPFYEDEDSYLIRLSSFDLNKEYGCENESRSI